MGRPAVFPAEVKTRIVLSILAGELTIAQAARRVRFDLTHMKDLVGTLRGTGPYAATVTGAELRHIATNWDRFQTIVTFYRNGRPLGVPPW